MGGQYIGRLFIGLETCTLLGDPYFCQHFNVVVTNICSDILSQLKDSVVPEMFQLNEVIFIVQLF